MMVMKRRKGATLTQEYRGCALLYDKARSVRIRQYGAGFNKRSV